MASRAQGAAKIPYNVHGAAPTRAGSDGDSRRATDHSATARYDRLFLHLNAAAAALGRHVRLNAAKLAGIRNHISPFL